MENSILEKEDKYIKDGYKQIYPNDKDIKVTLLNWVSDWVWICSAFQTRKLSLREAFKNKGSKFLDVETDYEDTSNLQLRLTKSSQKQIYSISDIFITSDDEKGAPYYSLYPKKIKEIYLNFSSKSVIIILDEKFKTKKEKAWIKKDKKKGDFTKNLESLIS